MVCSCSRGCEAEQNTVDEASGWALHRSELLEEQAEDLDSIAILAYNVRVSVLKAHSEFVHSAGYF